MTKKTDAQRIANLERELAALKAAHKPPPTFVPESDAEYRDRIHQMRERAANSFRFRPEIQAEMDRAWSPEDCRDINHASHAPQGPSQAGVPSSIQVTTVHPGGGSASVPGGGTGWARQREWGSDGAHPVPGVAAADRLMDERDRRDRRELAERLKR